MATVQTFEELKVWQEARLLVNEIYRLTKAGPFLRDRDLRSQIRRAATSTMSNVAEGFERGSRQEFIQFLNIAKGSNGEVRSQLWIALDERYLSQESFDEAREKTLALSRRIATFIRYLESCGMKRRVRKR